jgi:hypothetical protein
MSLEKTEVASVVELCSPFKQFDRGSLIALHQNFNIHDTEEYQAGRNRARGSFKTLHLLILKVLFWIAILISMMMKLLFHMLHLFLSITKMSLQLLF